jgi:DNA-binding Lrp family transcriptional regulator
MDEIDDEIIRILKENARSTYVDIGRTVGLSEGAVRNRVQAMVDTGVIRKFTIEVSTSMRLRALTMISVDPSTPTSSVSAAVWELPDVEKIYEVTGEYDIAAILASPSIEGVNKCIEEIRGVEGVVKTNTMIVLRTL